MLCRGQYESGRVSESANETVAPMAETCPSLADCTLMCVDGYARRADDCYVCQCVQPEFGQYRQLVAALVYVGIYDFYKQFQIVKIRTY